MRASRAPNFNSPYLINGDNIRLDLNTILSSGITTTVYKGTYNGSQVAIKTGKRNGSIARSFTPPSKYINNEKSILEFFAELRKKDPNNIKATRIIDYCGFYQCSDPLKPATYLVIQYTNLGDLAHCISSYPHEECPWYDDGKNILRQIIEGLDYMHSNNIVYADLKSSNILLNVAQDFQSKNRIDVKLSDFGIAKQNEDNHPCTDASPPYCSPEMWEGLPTTKETDIYQLGCVTYEITHWKLMFSDEQFSTIDRIKTHVYVADERPQISKDCSILAANFIKRCWERNPKNRPTLAEGEVMINTDVSPINKSKKI